MAQMNVGPLGFIFPLCDKCTTRDCSNPIEKLKVSLMGVTKEVRVYNRGMDQRFVVECEGFIES